MRSITRMLEGDSPVAKEDEGQAQDEGEGEGMPAEAHSASVYA